MDILSADIGGTNSRFAHFMADAEGALSLMAEEWFATGESSSFGALMERFRDSGFPLKPDKADIAVFAVAGPVADGAYSNPPLIPWDIDARDAEVRFGIRKCLLINDFVAQAYSCRSEIGRKAEMILRGHAKDGGAIAVLGAGTGLGKAALIPDGRGGYLAMPSEGGHALFPFVSKVECEYLRFLSDALKEDITYNIVVSGRGLSLLHRFLAAEDLSPADVADTFSRGDSPTLEWAARFFGRVCRNFALEVLATGGLYIAGGVAARNPSVLGHEAFRREFRSSSTHSELLKDIPVFLIRDENSGLWGSAFLALQMLREERKG